MRQVWFAMFAAFAALVLGPPASAQSGADALSDIASDLRTAALERADALSAGPTAPATPPASTDPFLIASDEFTRAAVQLSRSIDAAGGPGDLACIFRGMSTDAGARVEALMNAKTRAEQARVYLEMAALFEDAEQIAGDPQAGVAAPPSCPAEPDQPAYFTEQP